jgi:uncharacterized protein with von Willebrand factor type A (vWA) domain
VFVDFFFALRKAGVPVSLTEFLTLLEALKQRVCEPRVEDFYFLSRATLVKDERNLDKFDRVFGAQFRGLQATEDPYTEIPEEWLQKLAERFLTPEEMAQIQSLGGFEALIERLQKLLAEQKERHEGGGRFIGTAGVSPFGAYGYNPEGVRIGQRESRHRRAVKVWDRREFADLDDNLEVGVRNIQVALRRLRKFARDGAATELDLPETITATARNAGYLDLKLVPERHNAIKVLLLLDIGGSMDDHIAVCEALFGAAKSEFKRLEHYYFHNFIYGNVWRDHQFRMHERVATLELIRRYNPDYKVIFVGDAAMAPYEVTHVGGAIDDWDGSAEPGEVWFRRIKAHFRKVVWLNPTPRQQWDYTVSNRLIRELVEERMYPLTPDGLTQATRWLAK